MLSIQILITISLFSLALTYIPSIELIDDSLPANFSWSNVNGTNYLSYVRSENIPNYCNASWAFAATSTLNDRLKIARKGVWPAITFPPQVLLSCNTDNQGCNGGNASLAYQYILKNGIPDETCSTYQARSWKNGLACTPNILCQSCSDDGACIVPSSYNLYRIAGYGTVSGASAMMNEIYNNGPIHCSVDVRGIVTYTGGIINNNALFNTPSHDVSIVGWGQINNTPYWIVRNSWGSYWGERGFFRIVRGSNALGIESKCYWVTPNTTWSKFYPNISQGNKTFIHAMGGRSISVDLNRYQLENTNKPWANLSVQDLPAVWDWRDINGTNFLTPARNQHIPYYCGACWDFAGTSTLADRIYIANKGQFPQILLSPQSVINCHGEDDLGNCYGGDPTQVYEMGMTMGVPEESCQNYLGYNLPQATCSPIQVCSVCLPPVPPTGRNSTLCVAVTNYTKHMVSEWAYSNGVDDMKAAIYSGGPLSCLIFPTAAFHNYTGGIFSDPGYDFNSSHSVSVVGWGVENGTNYWVGRNSWGSYWGEEGFFRILMGSNNLGIENLCQYTTPIISQDT